MFAYCYSDSGHILFMKFENRKDAQKWLGHQVDEFKSVLKCNPTYNLVTNTEFETIVLPRLFKMNPNLKSIDFHQEIRGRLA